ncbi:MAG: hypothetical protein QM784_12285 [Polyangiaceae bacterium]
MKTLSLITVALFGVLSPSLAFGQSQGRPWVSDRGYGEGMGYRTGDLELHPGVAGEVGYDSNYFQRSGDGGANSPDSPISSALRFRLTPSLTLSTLSPQRRLGDAATSVPPTLNFRAGVFASYNELVGLSGDDDFSKQRHLDGGANVLFDILPQRPVGADVSGNFTRMVQPSNDPAAISAWNRDSVTLGAGVTWRPGGGLFDWRLGYGLLYNYFEQSAYQNLNNISHAVESRGRWKFLPRTAAIFDARSSWLYYGQNALRNDGQNVQARLGINGLVTNHFALLAMVGWGATYYQPTAQPVLANFDSIIGQGELKWYILPQPKLQPGAATVGLSSIALGYLRDFTNSYLADYYRRDRIYVSASYFVGGRYLVDLQGGYSRIAHPEFVRNGVTGGPFTENRVDVQLFTEYRTSDTFGVNATLRYDASLTNDVLVTPPANGAPGVTDHLAFSRFTGWLGARWFL